jgi:hypothetical protein
LTLEPLEYDFRSFPKKAPECSAGEVLAEFRGHRGPFQRDDKIHVQIAPYRPGHGSTKKSTLPTANPQNGPKTHRNPPTPQRPRIHANRLQPRRSTEGPSKCFTSWGPRLIKETPENPSTQNPQKIHEKSTKTHENPQKIDENPRKSTEIDERSTKNRRKIDRKST